MSSSKKYDISIPEQSYAKLKSFSDYFKDIVSPSLDISGFANLILLVGMEKMLRDMFVEKVNEVSTGLQQETIIRIFKENPDVVLKWLKDQPPAQGVKQAPQIKDSWIKAILWQTSVQ